MALSRSASVFAVVGALAPCSSMTGVVRLFAVLMWEGSVDGMQFTPCGKYLVVQYICYGTLMMIRTQMMACVQMIYEVPLHQYDVETMSCVRVDMLCEELSSWFAISPCSRVLVSLQSDGGIVTRHLYPHNSE